MTQPKLTPWAKGAPPMIGEWIASTVRDSSVKRWWNDEFWSEFYVDTDSDEEKKMCRRLKNTAPNATNIEWRGLAEKPAGFVPPEPLKELK